MSSVLTSLVLCGSVLSYLLLTDYRFHHWFVVPIFACGVIISVDAIEWLRGRLDLYDPVGVLGVIGSYFFFAAPLLCITLGTTLGEVIPPDDWREWLGRMAILNVGGIVVYLASRNYFVGRGRLCYNTWTVNPATWKPVLVTFMLLSGLLQFLVYAKYGGVIGYMAYVTTDEVGFQGMGWVFMFSECLPILSAMAYCVWCRRTVRTPSWGELIACLLIFVLLQLLFGGLRGSRSNTVWALFWAVGMVHLTVRHIPRAFVALGLIFLVGFMYMYGFYKSHGLEAGRAFTSSAARAEMSEEGHRTLKTLLLADFSRSDVQAFLLYRLSVPASASDYRVAYGQSYLHALSLAIPKRLWRFDVPGKVEFGTEILHGRGSYHLGEWESSRVYGIAGEAMLNFGLWAAPFSFVLLGATVGIVQRCVYTWSRSDPRLLIVPFLTNLCFVILVSDLDNVVFFLIKLGAMPMLAIILLSRICAVPGHERSVGVAPCSPD